MKEVISYLGSRETPNLKAKAFLNIITSPINTINLKELPMLDDMKIKINSRDPIEIKTYYDLIQKKLNGINVSGQETVKISDAAINDFKTNYTTLYEDFFSGLFRGIPETGYDFAFNKEGDVSEFSIL